MKKIFKVIICLCWIAATGCIFGSTKVSEKQVKEDIIANGPSEEAGLVITECHIVDQTYDRDSKTSQVLAAFSAENEEYQCSLEVLMNYIYLDHKWTFTDGEVQKQEYIATAPCDVSVAEEEIAEEFDEYSLIETTPLIDNQVIYKFSAKKKISEIVDYEYIVAVYCNFEVDEYYGPGWKTDMEYDRVSQHWDILGTYSLNDENYDFTVKVNDFDPDQKKATIEYTLTSHMPSEPGEHFMSMYNDIIFMMDKDKTYSSNGAITVDLEEVSDKYNAEKDMVFCLPINGENNKYGETQIASILISGQSIYSNYVEGIGVLVKCKQYKQFDWESYGRYSQDASEWLTRQ